MKRRFDVSVKEARRKCRHLGKHEVHKPKKNGHGGKDRLDVERRHI